MKGENPRRREWKGKNCILRGLELSFRSSTETRSWLQWVPKIREKKKKKTNDLSSFQIFCILPRAVGVLRLVRMVYLGRLF